MSTETRLIGLISDDNVSVNWILFLRSLGDFEFLELLTGLRRNVNPKKPTQTENGSEVIGSVDPSLGWTGSHHSVSQVMKKNKLEN